MIEGDILVKALADVRQRSSELQADYDRIGAELSKLKLAEKALAAIVEGAPVDAVALSLATDVNKDQNSRPSGRGSRGPRSNSAKGRLKTLLQEAGPQGLTSTEISLRLPDVAVGTLNSYLSLMVSSGESTRRGDFFVVEDRSADSHPIGEYLDRHADEQDVEAKRDETDGREGVATSNVSTT